jgi:ketosteroid isomerase-like protein
VPASVFHVTQLKKKERLMSDANVAVVKRFYECFAAGDMSGVLDCVADDFLMDHRGNENPESPVNKLWEGKSGMQEFFDTLLGTQDVIEHDVHEFFTSNNKVAVTGFFKGCVKETGKEYSSNWVQVWTIENGLAKTWKLYFNFTAEALAYQ